MPVILDDRRQPTPAYLTDDSTVADFLKWARAQLPPGRVLIKVQVNQTVLEGLDLSHAGRDALGASTLSLTTADQKELSLTMLGKLAALIEWLAPQHRSVAAKLEQGQTPQALQRLSGILSAWQQIQASFGNLAKMLNITPAELPVHELNGEVVLKEFCNQLTEIQTALQRRDFVLLADILQYEMDGAIANWMALLRAMLGVIEPQAAVATADTAAAK